MRLARRLPPALLLSALLALPALAPSGAAADPGTCTTAIGGGPSERAFDAPTSSCAAAVLVVSPNPADPDATVTLDGSQSIGGDLAADQIARYEWDFGDATSDVTDAPNAVVTHRYPRGLYTATLRIVNSDPTLLDETSADLIVSAMPVAALDAPSGVLRPGVNYAFDASASTAPGGSIARYDWDWGDGTTTPNGGPSPHHTFAGDDASTQVSVTVVNDLGLASAPARASVTVLNQLPLVQLIAAPATVQVGEALRLDATGTSDPDGAIVEYRWDLDANGSFERSTGAVPYVTAGGYPNPGVIVLRVKAIDDSGGSSAKGVAVTVARPPATGGSGSGSGSGSGGSGGAGSGSGGSARDPFSVGLSGAAIQRLKAALRRGVGLQAVANRAAAGRLTLSVSATDAKKLRLPGRRGKRPVAIGGLRVTLAAGRTAKPAIRLTARAARALRRAKPRTLRVTIRGSIVAGGDSAAVVRVVLLRG